jgi:hypothetical protein
MIFLFVVRFAWTYSASKSVTSHLPEDNWATLLKRPRFWPAFGMYAFRIAVMTGFSWFTLSPCRKCQASATLCCNLSRSNFFFLLIIDWFSALCSMNWWQYCEVINAHINIFHIIKQYCFYIWWGRNISTWPNRMKLDIFSYRIWLNAHSWAVIRETYLFYVQSSVSQCQSAFVPLTASPIFQFLTNVGILHQSWKTSTKWLTCWYK